MFVGPEGDALRVRGHMLRIDRPLPEFELRLNGRFVARQPAMEVERVAKEFPWIPHAGRSGFSFLDRPAVSSGTVEVTGLRHGCPAGSLRTVFSMVADALGPLPPTALRMRVAGDEDADFFRADGQRTFADFAAAVERHGGFGRVRRMLDWGCGCGRVTAHFLADGQVAEVHGVDIDGEAIAWCVGALPRGRFQQSGPYPPLPFPDRYFDLVVAYSVFTHLERGVQKLWLAEMRRVLSPGGLLLATAHGEFAAAYHFPDRIPRNLGERLGTWLGRRPIIEGEINDSLEDHALDGLAPSGYYRGVFQSTRYTIREWSRFLPVAEYRKAGAGNYQDLVVLRRPAK
ncbi:MAG: class I SAM-dependent methyltransferase [Thermoanaerobaculia bacterium]